MAVGDFVGAEQGDRKRLHEVIVRLKHDLGKYIFFQQACVGLDADLTAQEAALRADLLRTRSGPHGTSDAMCVWERFRPYLCGEQPIGNTLWDLRKDEDGAPLFRAIEEISQIVMSLRAHKPTVVQDGREQCERVAKHIRSLERRVRRASACSSG